MWDLEHVGRGIAAEVPVPRFDRSRLFREVPLHPFALAGALEAVDGQAGIHRLARRREALDVYVVRLGEPNRERVLLDSPRLCREQERPELLQPGIELGVEPRALAPGRAIVVESCSVNWAFAADHEYGVLWASATAAEATRAPTQTNATTIERFMSARSIWQATALCLSYP